MKFRITYMKPNGAIFARTVTAPSEKSAAAMTNHVVIVVCQINEVGAVIA